MPSSTHLVAVLIALLTSGLAPCGAGVQPETVSAENPSEGAENAATESSDEPEMLVAAENEATSDAEATNEANEAAEETPALLRRRGGALVTPLTDRVANNIRRIAALAERDPKVFAKMGGSSVESHAYLHCLGRDQDVLLGEHEHLRDTWDYFREGRAGNRSPFARESLVAQVGWSLRQGLAGRPSRAIQEIRATNARWALAFWGGNDVQGRNVRRYVERMLELIESLETRGVVPLLAATTPRGDDPEMDLWARRYNIATRGLADALALPYVDFYAAIDPLPARGLAGDGVHPNVLLDGGRSRPCDFTDEGLSRGQNQRNLRTLELLHTVRAALPGESDAAPAPPPSASHVVTLAAVPSGVVLDAQAGQLDGYACQGASDALRETLGAGPDRLVAVHVGEAMALDFTLYRSEGSLAYLGNAPAPAQCVSAGRNELSVVLNPGTHYIAVEMDEGASPILIVGEPVN